MSARSLYGVVCASICPMKGDGAVDIAGVEKLTRYLVDSGINCLYPNGTNGESLSLTPDERRAIARAVAKANAGRAVLYVQCGAATVAETRALLLDVADIPGADGAGVMTPVFFPTDDEALWQYYDALLSAAPDTAVYAYNIPSRTGNDLRPELLGRLMEAHDNLLGVKYSWPDVLRLEQYVDCCATRSASVLVGNDSLALACCQTGGAGWVSGPAAAFPKRHTALYNALRVGDMKLARRAERDIMRAAQAMADIPEIPAIKYMLMRAGVIDTDVCRPPFRRLTEEEKRRLDALQYEYLAEYPEAPNTVS